VLGLHVWPADSEVPVAVDPLVLDWGGPVGDRHHGLTMRSDTRQKKHYPRGTEIRNHRQVSVVEESELAEVAAALGVDRLAPGLIADNIYLAGATDLTLLPRMTRLVFAGGAVLVLGGENDPCTIAGALVGAVHGTPATAFPKAAIHKRGVTGWVEHPGEIHLGESVEIRP
jgi:MOSC domain-containing protein YiiM